MHTTELEGRLTSQEREIHEKTTALDEAVEKVNQAVKNDEAIKEKMQKVRQLQFDMGSKDAQAFYDKQAVKHTKELE